MATTNEKNASSGGGLKPSKLNKILAGLWCGALLRKGPLCCSTNCSCFNQVESAEAERARADEARWSYRSEKLAERQEARTRATERRTKRAEAKKARRTAKRERKAGGRRGGEVSKEHTATQAVDPSDVASHSASVNP